MKSTWRYWLALSLASIGILTLVMFIVQPSATLVGDIKNSRVAGQYGSYLGGFVGSLFSLAGVFLFFEALMRQQTVFERQQFEARYFELLKIHCSNVDSLHLTYPSFERGMKPGFKGEMKPTMDHIEKSMKGRTLFKSLVHAFNIRYKEIIKQCSVKKNWNQFKNGEYVTVVEVIDMAFANAFLGDRSQLAGNNSKYEVTFRKHLMAKLDSEKVEEIIKEVGESGSAEGDYRFGFEANIQNYFEHLYYMINFVDSHSSLGISDKKDLVESIRVQLSVYELASIFLYTISHFGGEWHNSISKGKDHFISKYGLLKNLREDYFPSYNWQEIMVLEK